MKNKQSGFGLVGVIVIVIVVALIGALAYIGYKNFISDKEKQSGQFGDYGYIPSGKPFPPLVSGVEYVPEEMNNQEAAGYLGKYAKVPGLSSALEKIAKDNPCTVTEGRFKQKVLGVTEDQTQALVGNSCGSTGFLRSFMVRQNGNWIRIGSSNGKFSDTKADAKNFNMIFDTPSCDIVNKYSIQKTLAPVCYVKEEGENNLFAGDTGNYRYELR